MNNDHCVYTSIECVGSEDIFCVQSIRWEISKPFLRAYGKRIHTPLWWLCHPGNKASGQLVAQQLLVLSLPIPLCKSSRIYQDVCYGGNSPVMHNTQYIMMNTCMQELIKLLTYRVNNLIVFSHKFWEIVNAKRDLVILFPEFSFRLHYLIHQRLHTFTHLMHVSTVLDIVWVCCGLWMLLLRQVCTDNMVHTKQLPTTACSIDPAESTLPSEE